MKTNRIEAALATLIALINAGMEYPDAHFRAIFTHALKGRQGVLLAKAYDAWCVDINENPALSPGYGQD